jgi:hypothetical protein
MNRIKESSAFALVFASLVACREPGDPGGDGVEDTGIEVDTGSSDASDYDEGSTTISFDQPIDSHGSATAEGGFDPGCEKVDLLFVIDNSGSMQDEQESLVNSFPAFIDEMQVQLADADSYHLGVISTDDYEFNDGCEDEGAMIIVTGGDGSSKGECGPYEAGYSYMTEADDLDVAFSCAAQIGTDGDGDERGMQTMAAALSDEMNAPGGCNDGFLRDDALLVIVLITDEEDDHEIAGCNQAPQDGSKGEPAEWFEAVTAAKNGAEKYVVVLSLIGPPGPEPEACPLLDKCESGVDGAEVGHRIAEFTSMFTYGFVGRVCEPSYASFFEEAVSVIKGACDDFELVE